MSVWVKYQIAVAVVVVAVVGLPLLSVDVVAAELRSEIFSVRTIALTLTGFYWFGPAAAVTELELDSPPAELFDLELVPDDLVLELVLELAAVDLESVTAGAVALESGRSARVDLGVGPFDLEPADPELGAALLAVAVRVVRLGYCPAVLASQAVPSAVRSGLYHWAQAARSKLVKCTVTVSVNLRCSVVVVAVAVVVGVDSPQQ